ncbi:WecB/TagA/CpsF family glycosyltransferase [Bosea sp. Root381]|uniref:WecB/TagA/CpsF family glycosyltransferase n=1 Tax=Bosea sp. Root381 TaxID=1736524 RepID=UPI000B161B92|nr:WecB/TagA/CpsF family glycosyltransferase [Bosea sp. Root381]
MPASLSLTFATKAAARAPTGFALRDVGGVGIAVLTEAGALAELSQAMAIGRHVKLAFCNANLVNLAARDPALSRRLAGFLVLPDGIGVDIGSRVLHGSVFPANLNGSDFIPALLRVEHRPLRVGMIGGRPGVADRAAAQLRQQFPQHAFEVVSHGYFELSEEAGLLARLKAAPPDLLLVAFGNPRQENWIADRLGPQHCAVAAGIGALFDFLAGEVPRAPELIRRTRLEWVYRLGREPRRLWRRYVLGNPAFLLRILRQRFFSRRSPP